MAGREKLGTAASMGLGKDDHVALLGLRRRNSFMRRSKIMRPKDTARSTSPELNKQKPGDQDQGR
ncbi:MAG: hypothetical protein K0R61_3002 [Microvirga sp.]|jgi:hypothetical protein|nr:hypothetical protein [Microvirga sp.]